MSSDALRAAARDLVWSVFTELGVSGVIRHHRHVAIDPEPILVAAPSLFDLDARLRDQVYGWCAAHADRISASRLSGLLRRSPDSVRAAFGAFSATLRASTAVKWPIEGASAWPRAPQVKPPHLPMERPALVYLRLRGLCGVGARADVFAELLARSGRWTRASELTELGYSKRAIAGILAEFSDAGIARSLSERNALTYQLAQPESLGEIVGAHGLTFPSWRQLMGVVLAVMELARLEDKPATVRRVESDRLRGQLLPMCQRLGVASPPETRANPDSWEDMVFWASGLVQGLSQGTSLAFMGDVARLGGGATPP